VCWFTTSGLREAVVEPFTSGIPVSISNTERGVGTSGTKKFVNSSPSLAIASSAGVAFMRLPKIPALNAASDSRWITTRLYRAAGLRGGTTQRAKSSFCGSGDSIPRSAAVYA
jgi:hypothetical protein